MKRVIEHTDSRDLFVSASQNAISVKFHTQGQGETNKGVKISFQLPKLKMNETFRQTRAVDYAQRIVDFVESMERELINELSLCGQ